MRKTLLTTLITVAVAQVFAFVQTIGERNFKNTFGTVNFLFGIIAFFLGLFFCIPDDTRKLGKGILLGSGIVFLITLSVCSGNV